jgi:hypothetical protein
LACSNNSSTGILKPEKMEQVLFDIMQADEMINLNFTTDTSFNRLSKSVELYQNVFKIHNISAGEFKRSFIFYQNNPEQLKPILDSLQKSTQRRIDIPIKSWPAK